VLTTVAAALANNPPPELPGFLNAVGSQLNHYGYWAVLLLVMLEDFGIPVPGETILIAAAIFAGAGRLNVVLVGVVGFIAAVIGDNIGFAIGHFGGRALALRWGKYVFLTEERLTKAEYFFDRHGGKIIIVARFIEGLRQANGIIAGISGMHWRRFVFFNAIGAALWVGTWVTLGYVAGNHINTIYHYITTYSLYALIAVVVLLAAYIIMRVLRRRRLSRETKAQEEQEKLESPASAGINEGFEAIEQRRTQEAAEAQDAAEINDAEIPDGAEAPDATEIPGGAETPGGGEAPGGAEAPGGREAPGGAEAPGGREALRRAEAPGNADAPDSAESPAGPKTVGSAEVPGSAKRENGAEVPESAKTKSS
jgi:membrane protein DedA with SNARE-associated domain